MLSKPFPRQVHRFSKSIFLTVVGCTLFWFGCSPSERAKVEASLVGTWVAETMPGMQHFYAFGKNNALHGMGVIVVNPNGTNQVVGGFPSPLMNGYRVDTTTDPDTLHVVDGAHTTSDKLIGLTNDSFILSRIEDGREARLTYKRISSNPDQLLKK